MILMRHSVRLRLTVWYALSLCFILLLFATLVYGLVAWSFGREANEQLQRQFQEVADASQEGNDELSEIEEHKVVPFFAVSSNGASIMESEEWKRSHLSDVLAGVGLDEVRLVEPTGGNPFLVFSNEISGSNPTVTVTVALNQRIPRQSLRTLAWTLALSLPVAILLATLGGYALAKRALAPVHAIADKARQITADQLQERMPVVNPNDEFGQLATVFNNLLDRLHESFDRLKKFTADASHELRTPLTAMRSVGEVALHDHLQPVQYREVIGSMLEEGDRLTRLLESLLSLARTDQSRPPVARQAIDASQIAREVGEMMQSLIEERGQELVLKASTTLMVEAQPELLRQALINLLDNAAKYTPDGGIIAIQTKLTPSDEVIIEVTDTGLGIPIEHQSKVFDRFYRVDKARSRETGGVGLGLALAKVAMEMNGGRIELESEPGKGSTFRVVLPGLIVQQAKGGNVPSFAPNQGESL